MKKTRILLEILALAAVLAALTHTVLDDLVLVIDGSLLLRRRLLFAGLGLDLFLFMECILRGYHAFRYRQFRRYLVRQGGWIDLVASAPLLLLVSGPAVLGELAGGIVPVSLGLGLALRHLRLLRFLKLLRYLGPGMGFPGDDSAPAGGELPASRRWVPLILAVAVIALAGIDLLIPWGGSAGAGELPHQERTLAALQEEQLLDQPGELRRFLEARGVLLLEYRGTVLYSRHDQADYDRLYGPGDYQVLEAGEITLFSDLKPLLRSHGAAGLRYATLTGVLVLGAGFLGGAGGSGRAPSGRSRRKRP
ncbi:hypothetical protein AU468_11790 [Alkalispirochaeta sphaeroplastigenens]|uniref:Ion transport domain-containing protein n=1 Tax=Alkalispirochaeta sphaeroplastigenens TaxID=1187066 RepID=A0A2S4JGX3_9SPIO|nr:hypothetical protein [Alkalispirochaeta sphaeroplastigenens]POQ98719.1 hypothetical protein AU468_11790 [Alkalispirochaeta sphaeroplastigenens]